MALFKCKSTGNTVEFDLEWDVVQMRAHPDYDEVIVEEEKKKPEVKVKKTTVSEE